MTSLVLLLEDPDADNCFVPMYTDLLDFFWGGGEGQKVMLLNKSKIISTSLKSS